MTFYWNRNQSMLLGVLVAVVVVVGFLLYTMWLSPLTEEKESLDNQVATKENAVEILREDSGSDAISELESKQLQNILPVEKQEDQFLLMLERAEAASRTSIQSIARVDGSAPAEETEDPGVQPLTYELEMVSETFGDLMQFLSNLEGMERYSLIQSITFDSSAVEEGSGEVLYYFVRVSTYHYPTLEALEPEAPSYNYGDPSGKVTPFETE
ncbi:hypothetical protein [Salimicrobium halophilum]|uniref:Type IV pilus assembly protein PilO n=1 Tax=Salimicrobium halophilum TaxID=86666 RepID=A0A1G8PJC0_9BACI|nr:hypothetical protein [Salimicrobium halophilum]SDI92631.1 hypothetical protein SAMN04490247_0032 [Salimicrobium halophilum]